MGKSYIAAVGKPGRLLAARILPEQDVYESIIRIIQENELNSGTISAIGSLKKATVMYPRSMEIPDTTTKDPTGFANVYKMEGPVELGWCYGTFGTEDNNEINMHLHGLIMDKAGNFRCGNLLPGSAPVFATVDLTIQEMEGISLKPTLDIKWGHKFLHPIEI